MFFYLFTFCSLYKWVWNYHYLPSQIQPSLSTHLTTSVCVYASALLMVRSLITPPHIIQSTNRFTFRSWEKRAEIILGPHGSRCHRHKQATDCLSPRPGWRCSEAFVISGWMFLDGFNVLKLYLHRLPAKQPEWVARIFGKNCLPWNNTERKTKYFSMQDI